MEKKNIQEWLKGIDSDFDNAKANEIKMIRHADSRTSGNNKKGKKLLIDGEDFPTNIPNLYSLYIYRKDLFIKYQSEQEKRRFPEGIKYIVSFIGEKGTTARFAGVYKIIGRKNSIVYNDELVLELQDIEAFKDLEETLIIEWGSNTNAWCQYYNNEKEVIRKEDKSTLRSQVKPFKSLLETKLSYAELKAIINNPDWVENLKKKNCIYVILDCYNGKQYVGSTYNQNGIYGRWGNYANNGHGDDEKLNKLIAKDPSYAENHFQWSILQELPLDISQAEAIEVESLWKEKLGTRKHGYNSN